MMLFFLIKIIMDSFISLCSGLLIYFNNPNFYLDAHEKGALLGINQTIKNAIRIFTDFINGYKETFFNNFLIFLLIIIFLSVIVLQIKENKNKKDMAALIYALTFGGFMFFTILLFAGERKWSPACSWVYHYDLIAQMKILFYSVICFCFGCLFKYKKVFYVTPVMLIFTLTSIYCKSIQQFLIELNRGNYFLYAYTTVDSYRDRYINERMLAHYAYKNKTAILGEPVSNICIESIGHFYNKDYINKYEFLQKTEDAYKRYLEQGGVEFKQEEIEAADFQKLLNKKFVLTGEM